MFTFIFTLSYVTAFYMYIHIYQYVYWYVTVKWCCICYTSLCCYTIVHIATCICTYFHYVSLEFLYFFFNWIYHPIQLIHLISILAYIFNWDINFNRIIQGDCFAWIISYFSHLFRAFSFCHFRRAYTGSPICMVPLLSRAAFTPNIGSSPYGGMQRNLKRKIESEK